MKEINNGLLREANIGEVVTLHGHVAKKRNLGGLIFIDLRDRSGIIQLVVRPENEFYNVAETLRSEYVIKTTGVINKRESENNKIPTGKIEVEVKSLEILNESIEIPFEITDDTTALEDTRLKFRYLDLRRESLQKNFIRRHKVTMSVRKFFDENSFLEVETPILCKSTPEGARDYIVPSRVNKGRFYALPQSPQLFKQLLMVSGFERYFQIAKCFRDEDLRADRQPEFTQIDVEMSYVEENDVMNMGEKMISRVFEEVSNIKLETPFMKMKYVDAIKNYGSDKPDLRFDMKIEDITDLFSNTSFEYFKNIISNNGIINAIVLKNGADKYSRKEIDNLVLFVKKYRASGMAYLKMNDELSGSISKDKIEEEHNNIISRLNLSNNDLVFIISGEYNVVKTSLGALRVKLAKENSLINENDYKTLWVVDFPSFEYSEEDNRYYAAHHPFTSPKDSDIDKLVTDPANCYSKAYDMVINGYEVGGGSIRIHNQNVQTKMFNALGFTEEETKEKFGFFVNALKYGTPPHGGIAFGLDRILMILSKTENIRDVVAFPKTASATDLMSEAPGNVSDKQLDELKIKIVE